ncbi:MAG: taurine catabolism dioxygenase TauD [Acidimicrobiaceae bacterium]|nr:taurine catabolism dioxygenase TauD [Acidimicrobiaceae bacterium]
MEDLPELRDLPEPASSGHWRGSAVAGIEDFAVDLDPADAATLEAAAHRWATAGKDPVEAEPEDLPVGDLAPTLEAIRNEVLHGSGMVLLRGFPVDRLSADAVATFFWGIGLRLGRAVSQSVMGERLGRVVDVTDVDPHARAYRNRSELTPHSDPADLLAFLCLAAAAEGGESRFVSSYTVHEEIRAARPDLLPVLYRGFRYHRFGEHEPGCPPVTPWRVPVFSVYEGLLSCRYVKEYVEIAADEEPDVEITPAEREALDLFEATAQRDDLRVRFTMRPGEAIVANNFTVLHARTAFTSHPDRRRELLRLWLAADPPRPIRREVALYERAYHGGEPGVPPQPGREPSFASRFDPD